MAYADIYSKACSSSLFMVQQTSLWQNEQNSSEFSELCNALYEREVRLIGLNDKLSIDTLKNKLISLPHYVKRTAHSMTQCISPLTLDTQNATWSAKQSSKIPVSEQSYEKINAWFESHEIKLGLVVPILLSDRIVLDCIDRVDKENKRYRTNYYGWSSISQKEEGNTTKLLKPNKKVMIAACCGHSWQDNKKVHPAIPSLRELLLSCQIDWQRFHRLSSV